MEQIIITKIFEIHITGEKSINEEFNKLGFKNITVELLTPENTLFRTEYMSSFIIKEQTFGNCVNYVESLLNKLKSKIFRVKFESPYYEELIPFSIYMESHFLPTDNKWNYSYPVSRNKKSQKLMATAREYNKDKYQLFLNKWKGEEVELCLLDSFKEEDKDWFELYMI